MARIRRGNRLELFIDGELVARSTEFRTIDYNLNIARPLQIGFGAHDYFRGRLAEIRLYQGALSPHVVRAQYAVGRPPE